MLTHRALLPHEIKSGGVIHQLAGIPDQVVGVRKRSEETPDLSCGTDDGGLSGDADVLGGLHQGDAEAAFHLGLLHTDENSPLHDLSAATQCFARAAELGHGHGRYNWALSLIDIPLTIGVVGTLLAPQLAAIGAIAALVLKGSIVIEKETPQTPAT